VPDGPPQGGQQEPWRDLAIEEYRALRAEVIASLQGQLQALGLGTAAIGVLAAGGFNVWDRSPYGAAAVFFVGLPLLALLGLYVWTGENARIMGAGTHMLLIEHEMRVLYPGMPRNVFSWEAQLAEKKRDRNLLTIDLRFVPVSLIYSIIAIGSVLVGRHLVESEQVVFFSTASDWLTGGVCLLVVASLALCLRQMWLLHNAHRDAAGRT